MSTKWLDDYMDELEKDNQQLEKWRVNELDSSRMYYEDYHPRHPLDTDEDIEINQESYLEMDGTMPEIRYVIREFKKRHKVSKDEVELVMGQLLRYINLNMYSIVYSKGGYEYQSYENESEVNILVDSHLFILDYKGQLESFSEEERKRIQGDCKFHLSCKKLVVDNKRSQLSLENT